MAQKDSFCSFKMKDAGVVFSVYMIDFNIICVFADGRLSVFAFTFHYT